MDLYRTYSLCLASFYNVFLLHLHYYIYQHFIFFFLLSSIHIWIYHHMFFHLSVDGYLGFQLGYYE